jgi:DNA-binding CsgD family transcriptional regulator
MTIYFDIFSASRKPFADKLESAEFLRTARDWFGVLHLSYWFLGTSSAVPDKMVWYSTYDEAYMAHYMRDFTPLKDKAFQVCFRRMTPLDWADLRRSEESVQAIHEVAERYGIGRHGISFPIREPGVGDAMFSVNFECPDRHWDEVRTLLVSDIHLFAHYFHLRMRDVLAAQTVGAVIELSRREREVLQWAAEGKTAWETAQLLGVSASAVNLYASNAMNKLRAKTKTQAVAIAVKNALLE